MSRERSAFPHGSDDYERGLSRRELFAVMVAQGILSGNDGFTEFNPREVATEAVQIADALIEALESTPYSDGPKPPPPTPPEVSS